MKILKNTFALLLVTILTFSCGNDDAPPPAQNQPPATSDYFFKAKVDGVQFEAIAPRVLANNTNNRITITSILPNDRNFELQIDRPTGIGTYAYPMPSGADYVLRLEYGDATAATAIWRTAACSGTTGTLTITALSATEVSGTFSFTGKRTSFCTDAAKIITEGSFKSGIIQ